VCAACLKQIKDQFGIIIVSNKEVTIKECFLCKSKDDQHEIIETYGEFGHQDCISDAIADAKDQEREWKEIQSHHGEYERDYQRGYTRACLHCGEGASPGTEFCSMSCANKFTDGDWD